MKKSVIPILLLVSIILNLVLFQELHLQRQEPPPVSIDTTTVENTYIPDSAADSAVIGHQDYILPVSAIKPQVNGKKRPDSGNNRPEIGNIDPVIIPDSCNNDTSNIPLDGDSVTISLPITQKVYRDSSYTAYVSGFDARLDSITIYNKVVTITRQKKPPRFNVGIQAGYGFTPAGFQPYIGVGVSYNLFK